MCGRYCFLGKTWLLKKILSHTQPSRCYIANNSNGEYKELLPNIIKLTIETVHLVKPSSSVIIEDVICLNKVQNDKLRNTH